MPYHRSMSRRANEHSALRPIQRLLLEHRIKVPRLLGAVVPLVLNAPLLRFWLPALFVGDGFVVDDDLHSCGFGVSNQTRQR